MKWNLLVKFLVSFTVQGKLCIFPKTLRIFSLKQAEKVEVLFKAKYQFSK